MFQIRARPQKGSGPGCHYNFRREQAEDFRLHPSRKFTGNEYLNQKWVARRIEV